ncbi:diguanylate cyclase (GGDEF)-like protein [Alkalibaculum bacchi]|uniref:Diguanylate cyclase (GGDEF)-like protein n=2 Tax=Alkalibaculum bacchi TaxID=645887 RepID=A0A366I5R6_9FIRM|nr:diguanylate cyclase (GGDEF)-like protein [Alkalibaculum bacchi]
MMSNNSKVVLTTSIVMFVLGVIITLITLGLLNVNVAEMLRNNLLIVILLGILFVIALAYLIFFGIKAYKQHLYQKNEKEPHDLVKFDTLTQLYNFDYFVKLMQKMEIPFSLVMLDIDDFKEINEKFDTVIGDLVLKVTAKSIRENMRYCDIVARYKGDAFLIILSNCPAQNAKVLMKQIQINIKENQALSEKNIRLSTSVGIKFVDKKEATEVLFRNAVEALCNAKGNQEDAKIVIYGKEILNKPKNLKCNEKINL